MINAATKEKNALLLLNTGEIFFGKGIGIKGSTIGELCFNTSTTGYQEIISDASYNNQIITFTFPHIGNVGCNYDDEESEYQASGIIIRNDISNPSNYRSTLSLNDWLIDKGVFGISGIDTRTVVQAIRNGSNTGYISYIDEGDTFDIKKSFILNEAKSLSNFSRHIQNQNKLKLVVIDYGVKNNILNLLEDRCDISVMQATNINDVMQLKPDGILISNGPGDPREIYTTIIIDLIDSGIPIFGICLGHQLLSIAFGMKIVKMKYGHRGANHPVQNLETKKVEITTQNHGFCVEYDKNSNIQITHVSLLDNTVEGMKHKTKPIFSVQYHPESSPGPHDSRYLFNDFIEKMVYFSNQHTQ